MRKRSLKIFLILTFIFFALDCASQTGRSDTAAFYDEAESDRASGMMPAAEASRAKRSADLIREESKPAEEPEKQRMMIYEASMASTVDELESAISMVRKVVSTQKGYIEKQTIGKDPAKASFTIRVPVANFDETIRELSKIGSVTSRNISAKDITREFADLSQRLENRKKLLTRLYQILKTTKSTKQKIRILNEIARLNKEIEAMNARKEYLAKKAAYSTIVYSLNATRKVSVNQGSAIGWIRKLQPSKRTLFSEPEFEIQLPDGFLDSSDDFEDSESSSLYESPDGVQIRSATIKNNPVGNARFYKEALLYERQRYPEKIISQSQSANRIELTTPQQVGYQKAYYTIILFVETSEIHVIEVYYPDEQIFKKQKSNVESSIRTIEKESLFDRIF